MGRSIKRIAIRPGDVLASDLKALEMSAEELALHLSVPVGRILDILNGDRPIDGDTALRLGHFLKTGPDFWLDLQKHYELRLAEEKAGSEIKALPTLTIARSKLKRGRSSM